MKKIMAFALGIVSCFALTGCRDIANELLGTDFANDILGEESVDESELEWTEVSTFEELDEATGNVRLTADIDCDYEMMASVGCARFDGQGFTIKNCVVDGSSFFYASKIVDVTLDNVTVQKGSVVSEQYGKSEVAGIVSSAGGYIENVTVRNSKMTCTVDSEVKLDGYFGVICGRSYEATIKNCLVENVTVEVQGPTDADIYVGGIFGGSIDDEYIGSVEISDCTVKTSVFTVTSLDRECNVYVGGIAGHVSGTIKNCVSKNNKITANANKMQGVLYGSQAYAGGVIGRIYGDETESGLVECCGAQDNEITVSSSGKARAGGLCAVAYISTVSECYAANNTILAGDEVTDEIKLFMQMRTLGGLIGYAGESTVRSSFAIGNTCTETSKKTNAEYSMSGGLIGYSSDNAVSYCAALNNTLAAKANDDFCPQTLGELFGCYVATETNGNVNECEVVDESFWQSEDTMKTKLNLLSPNWKFGGEYPQLQ